jgi:hypothetical protein
MRVVFVEILSHEGTGLGTGVFDILGVRLATREELLHQYLLRAFVVTIFIFVFDMRAMGHNLIPHEQAIIHHIGDLLRPHDLPRSLLGGNHLIQGVEVGRE